MPYIKKITTQAEENRENKHSLTLNFGPQHTSVYSGGRLVLELDGENVVRADAHIGFTHRGTEKLLEYKTYVQVNPYFDRLDFVAAMACEHAWCLAVEKLLGVHIPERAQCIRVLYSEMTRIGSHLFWLAAQSGDLGASVVTSYAFAEREKVCDFYEEVSGARMHANYFRPGGVSKDLPNGLTQKIRAWLRVFNRDKLRNIEKLLDNNRIFKQRTVGIGVVTPEQAQQWGFSGPILRASGVPWDLRKAQPYECYDELDFNIPVGLNGDSYDRYHVRMEEMRQSAFIMEQCLDMLEGELKGQPCKIQNFKISPPKRADIKSSVEAHIHHFKYFTEGFHVPEGECYVPVESPKGEFGVYLVSQGGNKPYRVHVRAPSFAHLQALETMAKGHTLADLVTIMGSQDVNFGEVDR